ncbi:glycogen debranching protein GlgX [Candidatus Accumulibacter cognatus]|uniref:Glycogen debranching enzyme n=1 Tax=Candidatus Accumulibacter cognatus TaxID=2954383 RepID=A0A080M5B9_9PROT|nr:glycogen debranching protein GlgX [Candidatus Accumulibacter cognatus]KFB75670.1 MAG: Glycogen debranching enzyme [Candidatus Accumulibacter cognatus]
MDPVSDRADLEAGRPWPLGASWDGHGVNFALFSAHAARVELCVFDADGMRTLPLRECSDEIWHGYLAGAGPGLRYAYRVHGPEAPDPNGHGHHGHRQGHRFDSRRFLLDPYAREVAGRFSWRTQSDQGNCLTACVVDEAFDWEGDVPPATALADTVLYEAHVKGCSRQHPGIPEVLRGTYAGLATPAMIEHFQRLGVTAINLLPVCHFLDEKHLANKGLVNYWGYNSLAFFAPEPRYAARIGGQSVIAEFKTMVRSLHTAGLEVILDVVFNHTAETDEAGPTLSFRGIDNLSYYLLPPGHLNHYENFTGCGNTLNLAHPRVLQMVMDALRYWVGIMHVDGFRFDLAATLTRDSAFLAAVRQDPLLQRVKLIAEPWDIGPDGYRLGRFLPGWSEWNDRFRDDVRAFWLTHQAGVGQLAQRLAGSREVFGVNGRAPQAGTNFITAHDGFTLRDLVSYQKKHNELNGEDNRDGHGHNHSSNCGEEGVSTDPAVLERRRRLQRALLATLMLSQGVPMLQSGDEIGRTQAGNNNAYCQDNAMTWLDWKNADAELTDFVAGLIGLRRRFPQLRQRRWLTGEMTVEGQPDVLWWHPAGRPMDYADWESKKLGTFGLQLAPDRTDLGHSQDRETFLLCLINRDDNQTSFLLPAGVWQQICDSSAQAPFAPHTRTISTPVAARSVQILSRS